ncbi:MAG TPA: AI-2E family transporter [Candidatus Binataceae bacterium]|nr:AI-2E family transporter [Candidatus Binataceae bacterium]
MLVRPEENLLTGVNRPGGEPVIVRTMPVTRPDSWFRLAIPFAIAIFLGLGLLLALRVFAFALAVLILSLTIASALDPPALQLARLVGRAVAVAVVYLILIAFLISTAWFVVPQLDAELGEFVHRSGTLLRPIKLRLDEGFLRLSGASPHLGQVVTAHLDSFAAIPLMLFGGLFTLMLMFFLSFYLLLALPEISAAVGSLFPLKQQERVREVVERMLTAMGGYIRGVFLGGLVVGASVWFGLYLLGVRDALALGVLAAFGEFFPYVGPIVAAVPGVLSAWLQSPVLALWTVIFYLVIEQIEGHLIAPNIMRRQTDISQSLVIIALFAGGVVGGLLGALVAIPIAAGCKVLVEEVIAPAIRQWTDEAAPSQVVTPDSHPLSPS